MADIDDEAELAADVRFEGFGIDVLFHRRLRRHRLGLEGRFTRLAGLGLDFAHTETALDGKLDQRLGVGAAERGAGMTGADPAFADMAARAFRKLEQAERVGDMGAALADAGGEAVLGPAEAFDQRVIGLRLVDRVEVGALDVLDDADLEQRKFVDVFDDGRNVGEPGHARGAPAAFAGDDLILARLFRIGAHEDRLEDAFGLQRFRKLAQFAVIEAAARLGRVAADQVERDLVRSFRRRNIRGRNSCRRRAHAHGLDFADQGRKAASEPRGAAAVILGICAHATLAFSRCRTSEARRMYASLPGQR